MRHNKLLKTPGVQLLLPQTLPALLSVEWPIGSHSSGEAGDLQCGDMQQETIEAHFGLYDLCRLQWTAGVDGADRDRCRA